MKTKLSLILVVLMLHCSTSVFAQEEEKKPDPKFYIFLCFGQSNMAGGEEPGPQDMTNTDECLRKMTEADKPRQNIKMGQWYLTKPPVDRNVNQLRIADFFGWTMLQNLPEGYHVGVINVSVPGCKIELYEKDTYGDYLATAESWMKDICKQYGNNPYQRLVDLAKIAQKDGVIKGFLLHQGESNPNDDQWCNKVKGIYNNLIKDLDLKPKDIPLIAGELKRTEDGGACGAFNTAVLENLPNVLPNSYIISSKGCEGARDGFHFTAKGYRQLGINYAKKMLEILGYEYKDPEEAKPDSDAASLTAAAITAEAKE